MRYGPRWTALAAAASILLAACTSSAPTDGASPSPSPSALATVTDGPVVAAPSVVVVLPARAARPIEEINRERADVEAIADAAIAKGLISAVRTVVPDRSTTVVDVLETMAEEGHELVCALGPGAARAVHDVARRFPGTKFCGAPGNLTDVPSNALIFDLRIEESAYLAGIAAAEAAPFIGSDAGSTPAIIVADSAQASRLQLAFDQGYSISRQPDEPAPVRVATTKAVAFDTAESLYAAGAYLIYTAAGRVELGVIDAARERDRLVIGTLPPAVDEDLVASEGASAEPAEPWALLYLGENLSAAFRDTLDELAVGWIGGRRSIGFHNGALSLTPGTSPVWPRIAAQVLATRDALIDGQPLGIIGSQ